MESAFVAVKGENELADTGKRDDRHRARTGWVQKRSVAHWCFDDPHMQVRVSMMLLLPDPSGKPPMRVSGTGSAVEECTPWSG